MFNQLAKIHSCYNPPLSPPAQYLSAPGPVQLLLVHSSSDHSGSVPLSTSTIAYPQQRYTWSLELSFSQQYTQRHTYRNASPDQLSSVSQKST